MRRTCAPLWLALLTLAVTARGAAADGLPVPVDGATITTVVRSDGAGPRYATVPAGERTQLLRIDQHGGDVTGNRTIDGKFTIPLVALDGTSSGLSADGGTLALITPRTDFRFPRDNTRFQIVDLGAGGGMRPGERFTLRGDFSFDALSPDGGTMYLVEYLSRDYNDYAVREYDLARGHLRSRPVLVAHEADPNEMRGLPIARVTSPDGRYAYTLYNGGGRPRDEAFIHVLDTVRGISHCLDLPNVDGRDAWGAGLALSPDGGTLQVLSNHEVVTTLDARHFAVGERSGESVGEESGGAGAPSSVLAIGAAAIGIALLVAAAFGVARRRGA